MTAGASVIAPEDNRIQTTERDSGSAETYRRHRAVPARAFWSSLMARSDGRCVMMAAVVVGLHVAGFLMLIALVAPHRYRLGGAERSRSGSA